VSHVDAPPPVFDHRVFNVDAFQTGELIVTLEGAAAAQIGPSIRVTPLALKVLRFWESRLTT
jgi:hypothetical protein